jgi:hypothetical protein
MLVEKQQNRRFGEPDVFRNILRVIKTCEIKLAILERLVEGTKQASSTVNRAARIIGSLKLAWKKKDIQGFESQLYDSTNLLTLAMMANLTWVKNPCKKSGLAKFLQGTFIRKARNNSLLRFRRQTRPPILLRKNWFLFILFWLVIVGATAVKHVIFQEIVLNVVANRGDRRY